MSYSLSFTDYTNKLINGKPHIWLQGCGWAEAKPAEDFKPGEYMMWNMGSCSKFEKVIKETAKTITVLESWGGHYPGTGERTMKKSRWVAIGKEK